MLGVEHTELASAGGASTSGNGDIPRSPLATIAAKLLHKRLRVKVLDGRIIVGEFVCMDKQGNIILQQVVERVEIDGMTEDKFLGQILVAQKQRVTCEVEVLQREAAEVQALVAKGMEISQTTAHSK